LIPRVLEAALRRAAQSYPVVTLTGPRQSGKTTLVRLVFPDHAYVSLETPDQREYALEDPRGFLGQFSGPVILDEAQRAPELFSYIQTLVDEEDRAGRFVLTGSQNFLLLRSVSQSLAGRCAVLHLLAFSLSELARRAPLPLADLGRQAPASDRTFAGHWTEAAFRGFYPRIHDKGLDPSDWLANYYRTYVERDVRDILNVADLEAFGRFVRLAAGRNGQLLNLSSLANDCGITHTTARRWLSILETSFLVTLLRPHHKNFSKRLIKAPKLYFLDTGLLCYLLRIRSPDELRAHGARGAVFESLVVSELLKGCYHGAMEPNLAFWKDSAGHEVDVVLDWGAEQVAVEVKSGETVAADFFAGLEYWRGLMGDPAAPAALVYGGIQVQARRGVVVLPWAAL